MGPGRGSPLYICNCRCRSPFRVRYGPSPRIYRRRCRTRFLRPSDRGSGIFPIGVSPSIAGSRIRCRIAIVIFMIYNSTRARARLYIAKAYRKSFCGNTPRKNSFYSDFARFAVPTVARSPYVRYPVRSSFSSFLPFPGSMTAKPRKDRRCARFA